MNELNWVRFCLHHFSHVRGRFRFVRVDDTRPLFTVYHQRFLFIDSRATQRIASIASRTSWLTEIVLAGCLASHTAEMLARACTMLVLVTPLPTFKAYLRDVRRPGLDVSHCGA